jgi:hypothetical protein
MEQAQLFKRLFDMTMFELKSFIKPSESIASSLYKLDMAGRIRHIIGTVQLEDVWQEKHSESGKFELHLDFKLSPDALASNIGLNSDMNTLEWHFVLPKLEDITKESVPVDFANYLDQMLRVDIMGIDQIDIEQACAFLECAFDFMPFRNSPPSFDLD